MNLKKVKVSDLKPAVNNPRVIRDHKYKELVRSLKESPELLDVFHLVVDEDMNVLGGNQRLKALKEAKVKEINVVVREWDKDKDDEFMVKDNVNYGTWDWDILANQYDTESLKDYGLAVWQPDEAVKNASEPLSLEDYDDEPSGDMADIDGIENVPTAIKVPVDFNITDYSVAIDLYGQLRDAGYDMGHLLVESLELNHESKGK